MPIMFRINAKISRQKKLASLNKPKSKLHLPPPHFTNKPLSNFNDNRANRNPTYKISILKKHKEASSRNT